MPPAHNGAPSYFQSRRMRGAACAVLQNMQINDNLCNCLSTNESHQWHNAAATMPPQQLPLNAFTIATPAPKSTSCSASFMDHLGSKCHAQADHINCCTEARRLQSSQHKHANFRHEDWQGRCLLAQVAPHQHLGAVLESIPWLSCDSMQVPMLLRLTFQALDAKAKIRNGCRRTCTRSDC